MTIESQTVIMDTKGDVSSPPTEKDQEAGVANEYIDHAAERAYVRKLDFYLLPFLSLVSLLVYLSYDLKSLARDMC